MTTIIFKPPTPVPEIRRGFWIYRVGLLVASLCALGAGGVAYFGYSSTLAVVLAFISSFSVAFADWGQRVQRRGEAELELRCCFIRREGAVPTWQEVIVRTQRTGPVNIVFDDTFAPCAIPAGYHDMKDVTWTGKENT